MTRFTALVAAAALAGCFRPALSDGQFTCGEDELCPPGLTCGADGVCAQDPLVLEDAGERVERVGDPLALYDFSEPSGAIVRDRSDVNPRLDLEIVDPLTGLVDAGLVNRDGAAIEIAQPAVITTDAVPRKLFDELRRTNAITLEAWIDPDGTIAGGPRRIATLSVDALFHHFMFAHGGDAPEDERAVYTVRMRTTDVVQQRGQPQMETPGASVVDALTHVVYTRDASGDVRAYLDGVETALTLQRRTGSFDVWTETEPLSGNAPYRFKIGGELGSSGRTFFGRVHLVALYARALSPQEVDQNFRVGPDPELE